MHALRFGIAGVAMMLLTVTGGGAVGQASPQTAAVKNPVAASPDSITAGKEIYLRRCASCHAATGEGGPGNDLIPAAPSLVDDAVRLKTDGQVFNNIKNGVAPDFNMVPFKDTLKDDEIWNVVNYLRSIEKK